VHPAAAATIKKSHDPCRFIVDVLPPEPEGAGQKRRVSRGVSLVRERGDCNRAARLQGGLRGRAEPAHRSSMAHFDGAWQQALTSRAIAPKVTRSGAPAAMRAPGNYLVGYTATAVGLREAN
jgi:hypothetical protein